MILLLIMKLLLSIMIAVHTMELKKKIVKNQIEERLITKFH